MCRSIRQLRRAEDDGPATTGEAHAAALQYVRKVSGYRTVSARHREAFDLAVAEVAAATELLLAAIGTSVADGPDPFADPVTRRAILDARPGAAGRGRGRVSAEPMVSGSSSLPELPGRPIGSAKSERPGRPTGSNLAERPGRPTGSNLAERPGRQTGSAKSEVSDRVVAADTSSSRSERGAHT